MKTEINLNQLTQNLKLDYPELLQITDDSDGYIRLIGYVSDLPIYREKRWFVTAEVITINPSNMKVLKIEPVTTNNRDWVVTNDYQVIVTENGNPVINENFQPTEDITLENSPYVLSNAFDFFFGIRHSKTTFFKMSDLFRTAVERHDKWGYFDKKTQHLDLIEMIKMMHTENI